MWAFRLANLSLASDQVQWSGDLIRSTMFSNLSTYENKTSFYPVDWTVDIYKPTYIDTGAKQRVSVSDTQNTDLCGVRGVSRVRNEQFSCLWTFTSITSGRTILTNTTVMLPPNEYHMAFPECSCLASLSGEVWPNVVFVTSEMSSQKLIKFLLAFPLSPTLQQRHGLHLVQTSGDQFPFFALKLQMQNFCTSFSNSSHREIERQHRDTQNYRETVPKCHGLSPYHRCEKSLTQSWNLCGCALESFLKPSTCRKIPRIRPPFDAQKLMPKIGGGLMRIWLSISKWRAEMSKFFKVSKESGMS